MQSKWTNELLTLKLTVSHESLLNFRMEFSCKKCVFKTPRKFIMTKHVYSHVAPDQWPLMCPFTECRWYCKFASDYRPHQDRKKHVFQKFAYPEVDETRPLRNPNHIALNEEDWYNVRPLNTEPLKTPSPPPSPISSVSTPLHDERPFKIPRLSRPVQEPLPIRPASPLAVASVENTTPATPIITDPQSSTPTTDVINKEIIITRKDLSHHFLQLNNEMRSESRNQMAAIADTNTKLGELNTRVSNMEDLVQTSVGMQLNSMSSIRLRLAGVIDDFLKIVAPLHNHDVAPGVYHANCEKCVKTEQLLFEAVQASSPSLLVMTHRVESI